MSDRELAITKKINYELIEKDWFQCYQRDSDNFVCLSDICMELKQPVSTFFESVSFKFYLVNKYPNRGYKPHQELNLQKVMASFPELVTRSLKSSDMDSGIWVSGELVDAIAAWSKNLYDRRWFRFITPDLETRFPNQLPVSLYEFFSEPIYDPDNWHRRATRNYSSIEIHEPTGYLRQSQHENLQELLGDVGFLRALTIVAQEHKLSIPRLTSCENESGVFVEYRDFFRILKLNDQMQVFIHPEVMQIYQPSNQDIRTAIANWQSRTNLGFSLDSIIKLQHNLYDTGRIVPPNCKGALHHSADYHHNGILLVLTGHKHEWQFFVNLREQIIYLHPELLDNNFEILTGTFPTNYTCQRYLTTEPDADPLEDLVAIKILKIIPERQDFDILEYYRVDEENEELIDNTSEPYKIHICPEVKQAMEYLLDYTFRLIDPDNVEHSLEHLGYQQPKLEPRYKDRTQTKTKAAANEPAGELTIASEQWRIIKLGDVEVRQRLSDGFLCANDMCRPFKNVLLSDWLKLDRTWNEFEAMARFKQLDFNYGISHSSINTRVIEAFPALIERKAGNSFNGGGTWLDPHLSQLLAQWLDSDFAVKVSFQLEEYYAIKKLMEMKPNLTFAQAEAAIETALKRKPI